MVTGLLLTAVLSILSVTAYLTTSNELKITRNYQTAKTAFYSTEGGIAEAKARLKGVTTSENYAGDPDTTPDPDWAAYIVTSDLIADGWQLSTDDANYNGSYRNYFPTPGSPPDPDNPSPGTGNSIQTEMSFWVKIRHKREYDAELMGHTPSTRHYDDDDGDTSTNTLGSPGNIIFYGYKTDSSTAQTEFTTASGNPAKARPIEVIRGYGYYQGSKKIIETEVKRSMGPPINSALYGNDVIGKGASGVDGVDNCGVSDAVPTIGYTTYFGWNPANQAPEDIEQVPEKDIQTMIDDLKGDADIIVTSDQTNYVIGSSSDYKITYVNANALSDNEIKFNNLTGYGLLLIDGDAEFAGSLDWWGIILISDDVYFKGGGGGKNIYGAVLVEDEATMNGIVEIRYDTCEIKNALSGGSIDSLRWRDRGLG